MSINPALNSAMSLTNEIQNGVGTVTRIGADLGLSVVGGAGKKFWKDTLREASYRGVKFHVLEGQSQFGRRNVVHEYPFRDTVWVEDLGLSARRFDVIGFLVSDDQNDCVLKRAMMINVCEQDGFGTLVHPTYGTLTVNLLKPLTVTERWDKGRMFEIHFSFIESGEREFPSDDDATIGKVKSAADATDMAAASDFKSMATAALKNGAAVVAGAVSTAKSWIATAQRLSNDATNLVNLVRSLPGAFGRFAGEVRGLLGAGRSQRPTTVSALVAQGSAARETVHVAMNALSSSAAGLSIASASSFASAAQTLTTATLAAVNDPSDAVRLLSELATQQIRPATPGSPIGQSVAAIQGAVGDVFRRAAVTAMARASADFQPTSVDDAVAMRTTVCNALDAEIIIAGDQHEDATYNALRALRAAVVSDLSARGAGLSSVITVSSPLPLPSLALAQRTYRDATRSDDLIAQSGAIHPAFMPTVFKALT